MASLIALSHDATFRVNSMIKLCLWRLLVGAQ